MRLIGLAVVLALSLTLAPLASEAQQPGKMWRIGVLVPAETESPTEPDIAAFRQGLRDLGYVEGKNIAIEYRYAHGRTERYSELVGEFVRLKVDLMVVGSGAPTLAAKNATKTIPIVAVGMGDPVGTGLVASLNRPGGNITGLSSMLGAGFTGKLAELLKEAAPRISRLGYLRDPDNPLTAAYLGDLQTASRALGLTLQVLEIREIQKLDSGLAEFGKEHGGGLVVMNELRFYPHRSRIAELAAKHRIPAIYPRRAYIDAGGLMAYGASLPDTWRRAATLVDKILRGAKPADLPVEQPTKFEFVINLKTAKTFSGSCQATFS